MDLIKKAKALFSNKKGNVGVGAVLMIVGMIAATYIGILVADKVDKAIPSTGLSTALATSRSNTQNNTGGAFDLISIAPIAAAAGLVIAMLVGWMGTR